MSAIRSSTNRAQARRKNAMPYGRSVVSTVCRFLGITYGQDDRDASDLPTDANPVDRNESNEFFSNPLSGQQDNSNSPLPQRPSGFFSRPPLTQVRPPNSSAISAESTSSTVPDARLVASYLSQRTGANIDANFVESMVTDLQTTPPESTQKFRFTFTTPSRDSSPFPAAHLSPNATPSPSPRKKLTKNPNGVYRWEGAGSAKHTRPRTNRYASPAFGASPSKPDRLVMKDSIGLGETSSDNKRRKVGEAGPSGSRLSESESSGPSVPFPATGSPTPPHTAVTSAKPSAASSSSRLRTPAKPTAPVIPSPLRQAWSDATPTNSSPDDLRKQSPSHPPKQTKTANFMAELIKETTPPSKPDLSNPYQLASPVGKVGPPRRSKRTRATGRPVAPTKEQQAEEAKKKEEQEKQKEKEKLQAYSPQAIIEATVPKGSKRSRPPAHFEKAASESHDSDSTDSTSMDVDIKKATYIVEEVDEDAEESSRSSKRSKPSINGNGLPSGLAKKTFDSAPASDITIKEIEADVTVDGSNKGKQKTEINGSAKEPSKLTMPTNGNVAAAANGTSSPTSRSSFSAFKSIPKEPSKLRFSFQAEGASTPRPVPQAPSPLQPSPPAAPKADFKFAPPSADFNFSFKSTDKSPSQERKSEDVTEAKPMNTDDIKAKVRAMDPKSLPVYTFTFIATSTSSEAKDRVRAREDAKVLPPAALPKFDFVQSEMGSPLGFKFDLCTSKPPQTFASFSPTSFGPGSGGLSSSGNSDFAKDSKLPSTSAPVKGFDFAAAGMKVPETKKDVWVCSLCGLSNPKSVSQCETCETPAPAGVSSSPAPKTVEAPKPTGAPVAGFNWAAAGLKAPTASTSTWSCSLCGLSNPSAASQCETCETPK